MLCNSLASNIHAGKIVSNFIQIAFSIAYCVSDESLASISSNVRLLPDV